MIDMITNAKVLQYVPPPIGDADGNLTPSAPSMLTTRCAADAPSRGQLLRLGAKVIDASNVLFVPMGKVLRPEPGGVYTVALDGQASAPINVQVMHVVDRIHSVQSHYEVFGKSA